MLDFITWTASPEIFSVGPITLRWYGMMFAIGFLLGFMMVRRMFLREGAPEEWLDYCFYFLIGGTILGARLGHILFYQCPLLPVGLLPPAPRRHHQDMGGRSGQPRGRHWRRHGTLALQPLRQQEALFWISDKVAAPIALVGAMIRFGNLMNSEIVGTPSDAPWAFLFVKALPADLADVPRHPVQLYESLSYLLTFAILITLYWKTDARHKPGFLTGLWFVLIFGFRFVWEYFKSDQGGFGQALTTGQWLSVPCVLGGLVMMALARREKG